MFPLLKNSPTSTNFLSLASNVRYAMRSVPSCFTFSSLVLNRSILNLRCNLFSSMGAILEELSHSPNVENMSASSSFSG